jgi:hypothetical protein
MGQRRSCRSEGSPLSWKSTHTSSSPRRWLPRVTLVVALVVAVFLVLSYFQMRGIENGVLATYADEQDGYIKLVVEQINQRQDRDNDKIIKDILGTLDSSSKQYWMFSSDQSMLFVKNVEETDEYRACRSSRTSANLARAPFTRGSRLMRSIMTTSRLAA